MAFPTIVTSGRDAWNNNGSSQSSTIDVPYMAGNVDDLVIVAVRNGRVYGAALRYFTSTPSGWTRLAEIDESGGNYAGIIIAKKMTSTGSGTVSIPIDTGTAIPSAVIYRIDASTWYGTVADGVEATMIDSGTTNAPSLSPSWGAADNFWVAGILTEASLGDITSNPSNYTDLVDSKALEGTTASSNYWYSRAFSAERELNAASEDPGAWTISNESFVGPYAFTVAVRPANSGPSFSVTPSVSDETSTSYTLTGTLSRKAKCLRWPFRTTTPLPRSRRS